MLGEGQIHRWGWRLLRCGVGMGDSESELDVDGAGGVVACLVPGSFVLRQSIRTILDKLQIMY
jgi:hypothetical protein